DITYGTNNEFGFDYLRDNMVYSTAERVQRELNFAIVDEVDSILIDEARTPLIISGQAEDHTELYLKMNQVAPMLKRQEGGLDDKDAVIEAGDYTVDLKSHQVLLTEQGHETAEQVLVRLGLLEEGAGLYEPGNILLVHHLYAALRAHALYHKDQQYVVQNGEVIIVDEFTGRLMAGRRWSDGLHQAVEAKEGVRIQAENQTLASITFQNYFRMYGKLAGMTGTADTEAFEFHSIYGLETVVIPTNKPTRRRDDNDKVYRTAKEKWDAVIADIQDCVQRGQPVLVGTTSIEVNEYLSELLRKAKIEHQLLNAKQHDREAQIVAQAGRPGMVTIATNMAGRGTDIVLGGNVEKEVAALREDGGLPAAELEARIAAMREDWAKVHEQVIAAGGLHIIGTERHESRRIDNQLRGRAGRQGDPGTSRFYLSLEDPLMKIFAGERLNAIMVRLKMPEGEAIEHAMVTRSLESAQRKVEQRNFDIRKQLLEYDDVANDQRKVIYQQRNELLETEDISDTIRAMRQGVLHDLFRRYVPLDSVEEQWEIEALETALADLQLALPVGEWLKAAPSLDDEAILARIIDAAEEAYAAKVAMVDATAWHQFERNVMLQSLDTHWREHLAALDHLRQGIHLRGYAQKNPKQEYKREAFELFETLLDTVRADVTRLLLTVQIRAEAQLEEAEAPPEVENVQYHHADYDEALGAGKSEPDAAAQPVVHAGPKVGRNDPCPCGSGKKYKHCHGSLS
ncbi:MAG: preprotein translocase subunit SecA, partial [Thauera phenolivorans]|nr:preprotein translocase subunit SecA [Thauera phenolivorans]